MTAVLIGGWLIVPSLLSVYNYGGRVKRAQRMLGVPPSEQISVPVAFLTAVFGFLVIPGLFHYWYVTKHQNRAVRSAGGVRLF